jgi:predicted RNase H-like HicB family nuclease
MAQKTKNGKRPKKHELQVIVEIDEDGKYVASCPTLQGCYTQGNTYQEAMENIQDVMAMCLEELDRQRREQLRKEIIEGCRDMADVYLEVEREYHPLEEDVERRQE